MVQYYAFSSRHEVKYSNVVIIGIILVCHQHIIVLSNPRSNFSQYAYILCIGSWYDVWVSFYTYLCNYPSMWFFNGRLGIPILCCYLVEVSYLDRFDYSGHDWFLYDYGYGLAFSISFFHGLSAKIITLVMLDGLRLEWKGTFKVRF